MKKAEHITSLDIAKFLNVEQEYKEVLVNESLKETFENFINSEVENNIMIVDKENEEKHQ